MAGPADNKINSPRGNLFSTTWSACFTALYGNSLSSPSSPQSITEESKSWPQREFTTFYLWEFIYLLSLKVWALCPNSKEADLSCASYLVQALEKNERLPLWTNISKMCWAGGFICMTKMPALVGWQRCQPKGRLWGQGMLWNYRIPCYGVPSRQPSSGCGSASLQPASLFLEDPGCGVGVGGGGAGTS